jgi:hypothetical protein
MKTITYKKTIEVDVTVEFPTITFKAEVVRISPNGDTSWNTMGYVPYLNGLNREAYGKELSMSYRDVDRMIENYVSETYNLNSGLGRIDWYVYSAKQLGLPELPKLDKDGFKDHHAELVAMFK